MAPSLIITVTRKPFDGTVTQNCLVHGAGALNIDGCRIHSGPSVGGSISGGTAFGQGSGWNPHNNQMTYIDRSMLQGRFPANMVLSPQSAKALDDQTGILVSKWGKQTTQHTGDKSMFGVAVPDTVNKFSGDVGGVSRFYKQFKAMKNMKLPNELIDYLRVMITPPPEIEPEVLVALNLDQINWSEFEDEQLHGLVARGNIEPYQDQVWRILKPGGHIMMIAPDEDPTNHLNACTLEDKGFEIRDAICVLLEAGASHYVAKASSRERNAGVSIPRKVEVTEQFYRLVGDDEPYDLLVAYFKDEGKDPERLSQKDAEELFATYPEYFEFVEKEVEKRVVEGNTHNTVKPRILMEKLLENIPKNAVVLDPFAGSGTTGVGCIKSGHSFIGIEKEKEFVQIAEARIRHWSQNSWWANIKIESGVDEEDPDEPTLEDIFGF